MRMINFESVLHFLLSRAHPQRKLHVIIYQVINTNASGLRVLEQNTESRFSNAALVLRNFVARQFFTNPKTLSPTHPVKVQDGLESSLTSCLAWSVFRVIPKCSLSYYSPDQLQTEPSNNIVQSLNWHCCKTPNCGRPYICRSTICHGEKSGQVAGECAECLCAAPPICKIESCSQHPAFNVTTLKP